MMKENLGKNVDDEKAAAAAMMEEVLRHGSELTKQLQDGLQHLPTREYYYLIDEILSCYDKAISMADSSNRCSSIHNFSGINSLLEEDKKINFFNYSSSPEVASQIATAGSTSWTPEISQEDHYDQYHPPTHHISKKRKALPQWGKRIRVASGLVSGLQGPLDDGYAWRKYGQKNIQATNFPRSYYRCTHRKSQGCLATKQVQKSDEDPHIFHVIYRGNHTCSITKPPPYPSLPLPQSQTLTPPKSEASLQLVPLITKYPAAQQQQQLPAAQFIHNIKTAENLNIQHQQQRMLRNLSFPFSTALLDESEHEMENYIFPDPITENDLVTTLSTAGPTFLSTAAPTEKSDSNQLGTSSHYGFGDYYGAGFNGHEISESSSVNNSPVDDAAGVGFEFELDDLGIDPSFTIDAAACFLN